MQFLKCLKVLRSGFIARDLKRFRIDLKYLLTLPDLLVIGDFDSFQRPVYLRRDSDYIRLNVGIVGHRMLKTFVPIGQTTAYCSYDEKDAYITKVQLPPLVLRKSPIPFWGDRLQRFCGFHGRIHPQTHLEFPNAFQKDGPKDKSKDHRRARVVDRKQFCPPRDQLNQLSQNDTQQSA